MNILDIINQKVQSLSSDKPVLLIFRGFDALFLSEILEYKLLDASFTLSIEQLISLKATLIPQLFGQHQNRVFCWCTTEEAMIIGREILGLYYTVLTINNNLYDHTYPALYSFDASEETLRNMSEDMPEYDDNGQTEIGLLFQYFGCVKTIGGKEYVVYPDTEEAMLPFYVESRAIQQVVVPSTGKIHMELSENEEDFLELVDQILQSALPAGSIYVAISGDLNAMPYQYLSRLEVLQGLVQDKYTLLLVEQQTTSRETIDETPYIDVLKRYWGYSSFRKLKMYKNVKHQSGDKSTIEISQGQIVDDLVREAIKANNNLDYRDIFVTSPTGAGKSVMFQVPAIYLAEQYQLMTIVVSPLIGLMNDQVQGLQANQVEMSATLNSEISPVEKQEIQNQVREGKISILYISPETLLSRSDISQLIGERQVGLIVIDEAHIVTTWGKAFRSDYWYLGTYLSKLRKEKNFPIATFTATAIYGGIEDMYVETRDSLNLLSPISYFGYVRRDNLDIHFQRKTDYDKKFNEYLTDKNKILLLRLERFIQYNQKTLVYFPTVRAILDFKEYARVHGSEKLKDHLSVYYGSMDKEAKQENYLRYKRHESLLMLATKAFGMGIDIPDIQNVYHFAPTGNVCDYVQEIGRSARALERGDAYFDFLPQDFVHVQRLHGISTIRKNQLVQVMQKVLAILNDHRGSNIRNLLVSAEEFRYIFQNGEARENDDIDNKIKTALLIIEKDFQAKLTYSPIVARPRSIFTSEYFMVPKESEDTVFPKYNDYFNHVQKFGIGEQRKSVYRVDMKTIWQRSYPSLSFPQFKYYFHSKDSKVNFPFKGKISPVLQIELHLKTPNVKGFTNQVEQWAQRISTIFGRYAKTNEYFSLEDFASQLQKTVGGSKYSTQMLAEIILNSTTTFDRMMKESKNFYIKFLNYSNSMKKYRIQGSAYSGFTEWVMSETHNLFNMSWSTKLSDQEYELFFLKRFDSEQEKRFIYFGLMEAFGLIMYRVNGGDNPEIYIRINSKTHLERSVNNPSRYTNLILENVRNRHQMSVAMLRYIFENQVDTQTFWDLIEDYFLGRVPDEVMSQLNS
ncbi:DEAD/DEAH box helicase [Paenibacillus lautus]|uniref:DEAD/DEAH box helicase n=1 Tax=Paenibacillus lautus TaxID=1401 RepID=UPI002FBDCA74